VTENQTSFLFLDLWIYLFFGVVINPERRVIWAVNRSDGGVVFDEAGGGPMQAAGAPQRPQQQHDADGGQRLSRRRADAQPQRVPVGPKSFHRNRGKQKKRVEMCDLWRTV